MISSIPKPDALVRSLGRLIQSTKTLAAGALGVMLSATPSLPRRLRPTATCSPP